MTGTPAPTFLAALRLRSFAYFQAAKLLSSIAVQIQTVAVGAQVYALTHRALDLGLIGLSQFLPVLVLALPAGHAADRLDRRRLLMACFALELICGLALCWFTYAGVRSPLPVFAVMAAFGVARAFASPAASAILPNLVPAPLFANAVGISSSSWQLSVVAGPAIGGALYAAFGAGFAYGAVVVLIAAAFACLTGVHSPRQAAPETAPDVRSLLEGMRFVRSKPVILGAISLDLFAVLFGGATAMLPAYASDVLHVGPAGLGWLRSSPGIGAALTALWLTVRPVHRQVGPVMFAGVFIFGLATMLFAVATEFWWALFLLALLGAADMLSVFVRSMLIQLETPDTMRGRVSAINSIFIGASNELGEFESGMAAAWIGLVPSVVFGGAMTVLVAALWLVAFPSLRRMQRFPQAAP